jgi:hypothetical protein
MTFQIVDEENACVRDATKLCDCWVRLANGKICSLTEGEPASIQDRARVALQMYRNDEVGCLRELAAVCEEVVRGSKFR